MVSLFHRATIKQQGTNIMAIIICTSLQTDNLTSTSSLNFYRPGALPDNQPCQSTEDKNAVVNRKKVLTRMWANAQCDGRPAKHRWCPLFNAAKFGWRSLLDCRALMLPRPKPVEICSGAPN